MNRNDVNKSMWVPLFTVGDLSSPFPLFRTKRRSVKIFLTHSSTVTFVACPWGDCSTRCHLSVVCPDGGARGCLSDVQGHHLHGLCWVSEHRVHGRQPRLCDAGPTSTYFVYSRSDSGNRTSFDWLLFHHDMWKELIVLFT